MNDVGTIKCTIIDNIGLSYELWSSVDKMNIK